ncbi:MAG: hypothetical protein M1827_005169 [Pycnora praestabilis]|nr:MAG: hypothetical protein M1827_005169 [Pycnora praestabilis]
MSIYDRDSEPETTGPVLTPLDWSGSTFSATLPLAAFGELSPSSPASRPRAQSQTTLIQPLDSPEKRRRLGDSPLQFRGSTQGSPGQSSVLLPSPIVSHHVNPFSPTSTGHGVSPQLIADSSKALGDLQHSNSIRTDLVADYSIVSDNQSQVYLDQPIWPLANAEEARLMRYFTDNLSIWIGQANIDTHKEVLTFLKFDLCDPVRHFALIVPQRAATCPTLLNAIFAASARHLSRTSDYNTYEADRYHQECLKHLIPMLDDTAAVFDENLLAATVILRFLEEVDVPLSGADTQSHLLGTHVFISAQERSAAAGSLRQAAFWVGLRQEIYIAFVNQRSIQPALEHCNIDRSFEPTDDCTWANRIVVHCAEVLRFCFGEGEHTTVRWADLMQYLQQWSDLKPSSFTPIFYRESDYSKGQVFPELWYLGDSQVTAIQHHNLSRILLAVYNPKQPRLGPAQKVALRNMEEEVKSNVRSLCGMALSNNKTPPNMVTACMGIAMCGHFFTDRQEQQALVDLLIKTENNHGWPTITVQRHLKEAWGWMPSD